MSVWEILDQVGLYAGKIFAGVIALALAAGVTDIYVDIQGMTFSLLSLEGIQAALMFLMSTGASLKLLAYIVNWIMSQVNPASLSTNADGDVVGLGDELTRFI